MFLVINESGLEIVKGATDNGYVAYYAKVVTDKRSDDGFYYEDKEHTRLAGYLGNEKMVVIPNSVTSIEDRAFEDCSSIISISIGTNVSTIGKGAFSGCSFDKVIWLPNTEPKVTGKVTYVSTSNVSTSTSLMRLDFLNSSFVVDGVKYVPLSLSDRTCMAIDYDYEGARTAVSFNSQVTYRGVAMTLKEVGEYTLSRAESVKSSNIPGTVASWRLCFQWLHCVGKHFY